MLTSVIYLCTSDYFVCGLHNLRLNVTWGLPVFLSHVVLCDFMMEFTKVTVE